MRAVFRVNKLTASASAGDKQRVLYLISTCSKSHVPILAPRGSPRRCWHWLEPLTRSLKQGYRCCENRHGLAKLSDLS
jgi:hypothetical protein